MTYTTTTPPRGAARMHYVLVDGTDAVDSVVFGATLREIGRGVPWGNLLDDALRGAKRIEPGQPLLERVARTYEGRAYREACVVPQGTRPEEGAAANGLTDAQVRDGNAFVRRFVLAPGADRSGVNAEGRGAVADIVLLSGHGSGNGQMSGNNPTDSVYFDLLAAASGVFRGPRWLIVANCNVARQRRWADWARMMRPGSTLRGVLAFQGPALFPGPRRSADALRAFLMRARRDTLREAWARTWSETPRFRRSYADAWVVLCQREAVDDRLFDLASASLRPVSGVDVLAFNATYPAGVSVTDPSSASRPLFRAFWRRSAQITPQNRNEPQNHLRQGDHASITVVAEVMGAFEAGTTLEVTLGFHRWDYPQRLDVGRMFDASVVPRASVHRFRDFTGPRTPPLPRPEAARDTGPDSWRIDVPQRTREVELRLRVRTPTPGDPEAGFGAFHASGPLRFKIRVLTPRGEVHGPVDFPEETITLVPGAAPRTPVPVPP